MDLVEYKRYKHTRHPWETSRYSFFEKILASDVFAQLASQKLRVLDAGSGDMWFSKQLVERFKSIESVICWDESYNTEILEDLKQTNGNLKLLPVSTKPTEKVDLVLAMDVLEHVKHDSDFLQTIVNENLKPGGWVLMSVPSWPNLFSNHDRALKHHRRYRPSEVFKLIDDAGLKVKLSGGLFHSLLPVRYLQTIMQTPEANPQPDDTRIKLNPITSRLMKAVFKVDNLISLQAGRMGVPVPGLSWWALCQASPMPV